MSRLTTGWMASATVVPIKVLLYLILASLALLTLAYQFTAPRTIDVGSGSDTAFISGFSFRETMPGGDFRWSSGRAGIRFWGLGNQDGVLRLRLAAPRPASVVQVRVYANGVRLTDITPGASMQEFAFPIDRPTIGAGDLIVTLTSDTFTQSPDTRELGVQVDAARFESNGAPVIPSPRALYLVLLVLLAAFIARVWSGSLRVGSVAGGLALLLAAFGLIAARVETVWFAAPLFWSGVALLLGALLFARLLGRLNPALSTRTVRQLYAMMALAFAVRMVFAVGPGFIVDVQDYIVWSYKTATYGLGTAYTALDGLWIADQSPGIVYLLHLLGLIYRAVFSPDFLYPGVAGDPGLHALTTNPAVLADPVQRTLLRMPALFADLLTGALVLAVARKNLSERGAWLLALGYWFNPAVLWNGAYWGQMDAVHTLLVLAVFLLLDAGRSTSAFLILGLAALTKPQAAIFGPLLLLWAYREYKWRGVANALIAGALGAGLMLAPIVLAGGTAGMLAYFGDTVGHHPILSANAHNLWWFLRNGRIDFPDTAEIIPGLLFTYRLGSLLLFGAFYLAALAQAWRDRRPDYLALGAFVAFAFFMLPTEIHENYGYALLPLLALAATRDRNWLAFCLAVSATMVLNYALSDPPLFAWWGIENPDVQLALPRFINSAANVVLLAAWTLYLFARRSVVVEPRLEPQRALQ